MSVSLQNSFSLLVLVFLAELFEMSRYYNVIDEKTKFKRNRAELLGLKQTKCQEIQARTLCAANIII